MKYRVLVPLICVCTLFWTTPTYAQRPPIRGHVYLPRTHGATVLSTYIDAEARRMVAVGDLLESMAIARRINVESDREAMKNSVLWVETYFTRKELNRQY